MDTEFRGERRRPAALLEALQRLCAALISMVEGQASRAVALYRNELRRAASVLALSLAAALLAFAALAFAAFAVMIASWPTHPVAASASIAVAFAALACAAVLFVRSQTAPARSRRRD